MFAYCGNNPIWRSDPSGHLWIFSFVEDLQKRAQEAIQDRKKKLDRLDQLISRYAKIEDYGFQIDIESETDTWDSSIKDLGIQESYDYIANQLCYQYCSKYGEEFLFSNSCVSYEIEFHVDAYMCATGHDGYNRNIVTLIYSYDSLKSHCKTIDITINDVNDWKQYILFDYWNGIRTEYQYTSKDPFLSNRIAFSGMY